MILFSGEGKFLTLPRNEISTKRNHSLLYTLRKIFFGEKYENVFDHFCLIKEIVYYNFEKRNCYKIYLKVLNFCCNDLLIMFVNIHIISNEWMNEWIASCGLLGKSS